MLSQTTRSAWVLAGACLFGCASSPPARPATWHAGDRSYASAYLDWMVRDEMARHHIEGLSLEIVDDHRVLFRAGYGRADVAQRIAATPDTVYRIGSVSKVITSAVVLALVERHALDLDAPVTTYDPAITILSTFPPAPITLRELLSHHSGLPSAIQRGMWVDSPAPLSDLPQLLAEEHLASPPGAMFRYSNLGYGLVGHIVEAATHQRFEQEARALLFGPLGMTSTSYEHTPELMRRLAVGYRDRRVLPPIRLRDLTAGSVLSTADDLGRYLQMILSRGEFESTQVLSPESVDTMLTPMNDGDAEDFGHRVGLDWITGGLDVPGANEPMVSHDGYVPPFRAQVAVLRRAHLGVVVLSNSDGAAGSIARIGARALALMQESATGIVTPPEHTPDPRPVPVPMSDLDRLAGEYVGMGGGIAPVWRSGDRLHARLMATDLELIPLGHDVFVPRAPGFLGLFGRTLTSVTLSFEHAGNDRVAVLRGGPTYVVFDRFVPVPVPQAWRARVGNYRVEGDGRSLGFEIVSVALSVDQGSLNLSTRVRGLYGGGVGLAVRRLSPRSDDQATIAGLREGEGETIRAIRDARGEYLRYSGYVFRRDAH